MNPKLLIPVTKQNLLKKFSQASLYVILSSGITKKPLLEILVDIVQGGADIVQLREKTMSDSEFLTLAREFRKITSQSKTLFIVNDRAEIAKKVDADGLHIGQSDIEISVAYKILGNHKIIGVSTHTIIQARKAMREGADYISAGPVFYTHTKDYEPPVGLKYVREVKKEIAIPFVALGAINLNNLNDVLNAGASCVAICSAILCSDDVTQTTRLFKTMINNYTRGNTPGRKRG
ncbi:MAG: thiamine phosphate synthase [wastewater metagenome]|nr:thiamine phosphate synthase [Candidatus Loosdrechtia aerotolerans]